MTTWKRKKRNTQKKKKNNIGLSISLSENTERFAGGLTGEIAAESELRAAGRSQRGSRRLIERRKAQFRL